MKKVHEELQKTTYRVDVKQTGEKEHGKQKATAGGDQERIQGSNGVIIEMNNKDIECNETVKRKKKRIIVIMINTSKEFAEL